VSAQHEHFRYDKSHKTRLQVFRIASNTTTIDAVDGPSLETYSTSISHVIVHAPKLRQVDGIYQDLG
jgi:hypothetical protein